MPPLLVTHPFKVQFYYSLVPSSGVFSSLNEKLRIMLIVTLIESELSDEVTSKVLRNNLSFYLFILLASSKL